MIPLEAICDFLDWQNENYEGEAKEALIKASNIIYDFIHKDDPDMEYGN